MLSGGEESRFKRRDPSGPEPALSEVEGAPQDDGEGVFQHPVKRAPLAVVAIAFGAGIGLAWWFKLQPLILWSFTALAAGIFLWLRRRPAAANLSLVILVATLGAFRAGTDAQPPPDSVHVLLKATPQPITCEGQVVSDAEWIRPATGPARRQGWLRITRIRGGEDWIPSSARVLLKLHAHNVPLAYGDRVRLSGSIRGPRSRSGAAPRSPIQEEGGGRRRFDEGSWLWIRGASGVLVVTGPEAITELDTHPSLWIRYRRWVASLRGRLKQTGRSLLGSLGSAYLEALLLGDGQGIPRQTWEAFKRSGTVHILVVSGQHVALVGYIIFLGLSFARIPRGYRYLGVAGALMVYCTLTGAAPPILRSTIMGVLLCIGKAQGREVSPMNSLGLAALLILAGTPRALADASFQLSFAAVVGLLVLAPRFEGLFQRWGNPAGQWAGRGLAISCGAWMAVAPFAAWHFRMFTPIAVVANLVVVPWASLLMATGFVVCLVGWMSPAVAAPFAAGFGGLAVGLDRLVGWIAHWPGAGLRW